MNTDKPAQTGEDTKRSEETEAPPEPTIDDLAEKVAKRILELQQAEKPEDEAETEKTDVTKVLYEVDAKDLKMADRKKRNLSSLISIIAQLALLFILAALFDIWGALIFILVMFVFLPLPIVPAPSKYEITSQGVKVNESRVFALKKDYTIRFNEERKFVSVRQRRKGEALRLYTPEPEKVIKILEELIKQLGAKEVKKNKNKDKETND